MEITNEQISEAYKQAKRVYANEISASEAKGLVSKITEMNNSSAQGYIHTFIDIMKGSGYTRTINAFGTNYYLENIYTDYGEEALLTAISSVKKHLEYYEGIGKSSQPKIHSILNTHIEKLESYSTLKKIENNFEKQISLSLSDNTETLNSRLKAATKKPKAIEVKTTIYVRNPDVVAKTLKRAKGICEKCNKTAPFIRAKDNTPYLEVHHEIQLAQGGEDSIENTLALCPNCHRELHFGN